MGLHQRNVRQQILEAGRGLILAKGFTAVGLAEVLAAAGVPKGSFYYYFESKERFGEALLEEHFAAYLRDLDALLAGEGVPARERLMRYWRRWEETRAGSCGREQCLVVKLGAEVSDLSEAMRGALRKGTDAILERIAACLREGAADGSIPPRNPESAAQALYELWLGASLLAKVRRDTSALAAAMETTRAFLGAP